MPFDMQIAPSTFDPEMRTVDAVVAAASPVRRRDAKGTFMEVLDVATLDLDAMRGVPVLDNHRSASVCDAIGRVVSFRREDDQLVATLRLSAAPDVSGILTRIADGTLTGVSIGYVVATWREASIAGQRTRTAVRWTITEVTLTTNPADPAARLRHTEKENLMEPDDQTIDTPPAETVEQARRSEIRTLVRNAGLAPELADNLIDDGADLVRAKAEIFDALAAKRSTAPVIRTARPANDDPAVITRRQSDAVAFRMGAGGEVADDVRPFLNLSLKDMATKSLQRSGVSTRGMSADEVFTRAAQTTSDFPLTVSNAMNKVALSTYEAAESPLKALCRQRTLPNF